MLSGVTRVKEMESMEELSLTIPALWADHHVLAIREVLKGITGVGTTVASARDRQVSVEFDPAKTNAAAISEQLAASGYASGEFDETVDAPRNKLAWATSGVRVTITNPSDIAMSGEFRNY